MTDIQRYSHPLTFTDVPAVDRVESGSGESIDITALVAAFRRRFGMFLAATVALFALSLILTLQMRPTYVATARVAINTQAVNVAPTSVSGSANAPVVSSIPNDSAAIDTEVAVISSKRIAERVVMALHLDQDPEFGPTPAAEQGPIAKLKSAVNELFRRSPPRPAGPPNVLEDTVNKVLPGLLVSRYNLTNAIDIAFADEDPNKAARIANAFAQAYLDDQIASKFTVSQDASTFLQSRLEQMKRQYLDDDTKLQQYKISHNLMSSGETTLTEQEIASYEQAVATAKAQAAADQADVNTAREQLSRGSSGDDVGAALSSGVIASLRAQRATISSKVADLASRYGERYPQLATARKQLADIDQQIQAEINRVISNLEAKAHVSRDRLASIEASLGQTKSALAANNAALVGLNELQQNAESSQALYQSYLNRLKETAAQAGGEQPDARLLSAASAPTHPSRPVVWLNLALGLVLGVGCGLIAVFSSEALDSAMITSSQVESRLGRRSLGGVPLLSSIEKRSWLSPGRKGPSPIDDVVHRPFTVYAEAFRTLRIALNYASPDAPPRVVAITSALPREGKTTVAICLARSAELQGVRSLLIDCDIRRRGVNQLVSGYDVRPGLVEVLSGSAEIDDALLVDPLSGASLLPINGAEAPAQDIFGSPAMDRLLDSVRERFDMIVLDCPPLLPVADARVIASKADSVALVARWRKTRAPAAQAALRLLPAHQVNVAGVVLTQVDLQAQSEYGYGDAAFYYKAYKSYYA
jgi:capsular exopolysaccharide synthesis family protein